MRMFARALLALPLASIPALCSCREELDLRARNPTPIETVLNGSGIAIGTYVGDGTTGRTISGLGFAPAAVLVQVGWRIPSPESAYPETSAVLRTSTMVDPFSRKLAGGTGSFAEGLVTSLAVDGFVVGDALAVNAADECDGPCIYYWLALSSGSGLSVSGYSGDGTSSRELSAPFEPTLAIVLPESSSRAFWRTDAFTTASSQWFSPGGPEADGITALPPFQVGTVLNWAGSNYHSVALDATVTGRNSGVYVGTGSAGQVGGVGFRPEVVVVGAIDDSADVYLKTPFNLDPLSVSFRGGRNSDIRALTTDGFEYGSHVANSGERYWWIAFDVVPGS